MYIPKLYLNNTIEETKEFITQNGFAILTSQAGGRLWATHIPLMIGKNNKGKDILHGHISKANPQWKDFQEANEVLVIFTGPHAYISSSWYEHENVPTWNYIAVHIYGKIKIVDETTLLKSLTDLVDKYEAHSEHPVSVHTMSREVLEENLYGVVGFEIEITEIHSAKKLSQNRNEKDHNNIIVELEKTGDPEAIRVSKAMHKNRNHNED